MFDALTQALFAVSPAVRYIALARGQDVSLQERPGLGKCGATSSVSGAGPSLGQPVEQLLELPHLFTTRIGHRLK